MPPEPLPPLRLAFDRDALAANWRALSRLSGSARAGAAVKANAYGLGARRACRVLLEAGCRDFFVAYPAEAAEIADIVPPAAISVLHGPLDAADAASMRRIGARPVINSLSQAALWQETGGGLCDIMVDTGINRLGLAGGELGDPAIASLKIATLMSHLASADEDSDLNQRQLQAWQAAVAMLPSRDQSLANSAGIMLGGAYHGSLTRPGLSLYGGIPCAPLADIIRPVVWPEARIIQIRTVRAGETIGYNATFTASRDMQVGVVAVGYADGYLRCWSGKGAMAHAGSRVPVVGRVSMDMTMVDLTDEPGVREGDWLRVCYDLPAASAQTGLSQYELLTLLGRRFQR